MLRPARNRRYMWGLFADEFGGIHLEALGQLPQRGHARLYLVALDAGDRRCCDAGALGKLRLGQRPARRA